MFRYSRWDSFKCQFVSLLGMFVYPFRISIYEPRPQHVFGVPLYKSPQFLPKNSDTGDLTKKTLLSTKGLHLFSFKEENMREISFSHSFTLFIPSFRSSSELPKTVHNAIIFRKTPLNCNRTFVLRPSVILQDFRPLTILPLIKTSKVHTSE